MTDNGVKEYDSVKVCPLDPLKQSYDEWKIDFYNLIGASAPSLYHLLNTDAGQLVNRPSTFMVQKILRKLRSGSLSCMIRSSFSSSPS